MMKYEELIKTPEYHEEMKDYIKYLEQQVKYWRVRALVSERQRQHYIQIPIGTNSLAAYKHVGWDIFYSELLNRLQSLENK